MDVNSPRIYSVDLLVDSICKNKIYFTQTMIVMPKLSEGVFSLI